MNELLIGLFLVIMGPVIGVCAGAGMVFLVVDRLIKSGFLAGQPAPVTAYAAVPVENIGPPAASGVFHDFMKGMEEDEMDEVSKEVYRAVRNA